MLYGDRIFTEEFVTNVVLLYKASEHFLIVTCSIDNLEFEDTILAMHFLLIQLSLTYRSIPERAAQLNRFLQNWFSLRMGKICTHHSTQSHCAKAGNGDLLVAKGERFDHIE